MKTSFFALVMSFTCSLATNSNNSPIPVNGLPNVGNSCYMNATLQCLFQIPEIAQLIKSTTSNTQKASFLHQCKIIVDAAEEKNNKAVLASLTNLFEQVGEKLFNNLGNQQEDALDFLNRLIDCTPELQPLFGFSLNTTFCCNQCDCILKSANQTMYDLSLDIFRPQIIDGLSCSDCFSSDIKANKVLKLNSYPQYLIVDCEQICGENNYDIMNTFNSIQTDFSGYELIGVVLHAGTKLAGHFIAYVKELSSGQWYLCDDNNVLKLRNQIVKKQTNIIAEQNQRFLFSPRLFLYAKNTN